MRITQLRIDRFGVWSGLDVDQLTAPMVVFYGENEAGKTTLMQFVRTILYGFSADRRERYVPPRSARPGGTLTVEVAGQSLVVDRHLDPPSGEELLEVVDRDGQHHPVRSLTRLLDGVDEPVYNGVFAFGLREIQELATLSDSAAAELLYELTLGIDRVSLSDVVGHLDSSRAQLLGDSEEHPGRLLELIAQRDRLHGEIAAMRGSTAEYLATVKKHDNSNKAAAALEKEETELDERLRVLAAAAQIEPRWLQRKELDRRRKALEPVPQLPDDAVARLAELKKRHETRRHRLERVSDRRRDVMAEVDRLKINDALCRQSPRLEALAEQQHWIASLDAQSKQLAAELEAAHPKHSVGHGKHSPGPADTHKGHGSQHKPGHPHAAHAPVPHDEPTADPPLPSKPLTSQMAGQLRSHAKTVTRLHKQYRKSRAKLVETKQSAGQVHKRLREDLGQHADGSLTEALEKAGDLVSQLRRRVQIEERLDSLSRNQSDLEVHVGESGEQPGISLQQIAGLGVVFAFGFALAIGSYLLPDGSPGANHRMGMLGIGAGLMAFSVGVKYLLTRFFGSQLDDGQNQLAQIEQEIEKVQTERDELDKKLPRGGGPLVARLQAAEKELARLEELMPLDAQHQSHGHTLKTGREHHKSTKAEFEKARDRWQQLLRQAGYPPDLTPRQLRAALEHGERLDAERRHYDERQRQLAEHRRQHDLLAGRIFDLAADARLEIDENEPLPLLREMLRRLEDERLRMTSRDQLRANLTKIRRVRRKLLRQVNAAHKRVGDLISSASAKDEDDLHRRAAHVAEVRQIDAQRHQLNEEVTAALMASEAPKQITGHLDSSADLRRLVDDTNAAKHALRVKLGHVWEERGAIAQQLKAMTAHRGLAEKRLELATVKRQLRDGVQRWQVLTACSLALESVRNVYERDRQPEVLREASKYLSELTAGRYRRIWTTLGGRMLSVDDADGRPVSVDVLSCGTREQIFLSLRLALVSAYARRGIRLPVVMDDVLVNFDTTRAKAAVGVLAQFAEAGHQLLVFTCHEHLAQLFHDARAEVRALPGGTLPWKRSNFQWDEPVREPVRNSVPAPHFVPEPAPAPPPPPPVVEAAEEVVAAAPPPPIPAPAPPPPAPAPAPVARRNGQATRPRRAKPVPVARPAPQPRLRRTLSVESVPWSAEEFEGELVDRVRRSVVFEEQPAPPAAVANRESEPAENGATESYPAAQVDSHPVDAAENAAPQRPASHVAWW